MWQNHLEGNDSWVKRRRFQGTGNSCLHVKTGINETEHSNQCDKGRLLMNIMAQLKKGIKFGVSPEQLLTPS